MSETNMQVIIGRLTRSPKLAYTKAGKAVLEFDLAWNHKKKDSSGQPIEQVFYFPCVLFGSYAEKMQRYLHKGKQVSIIGTGFNDRFQDKNGNNRTKYHIQVKNLQLLGGNRDNVSAEHSYANYEAPDEEEENIYSPPEHVEHFEQENDLEIF